MYNKNKSENLYSIMEGAALEKNRIEIIDSSEVVLSVDEMPEMEGVSESFPLPPPPHCEEIVAIVTKKDHKLNYGNMVAYNALPEMLEHVNK